MKEFKGELVSKLPHIGTTIFAVMTRLANECGAINLSQGFPDFPISEKLVEQVGYFMNEGMNQYSPMEGVPSLRSAIADKIKNQFDVEIDPEKEINITSGATQALFTAIQAVVNPGDEVIVFLPAYDSYIPAIELNGGVPVYVNMETPDFSIDWDKVEFRINQKTRMIIINSPHNPSGSLLTRKDMIRLEELTRKTSIIILSDEVYEHIIFDGQKHQSVLLYPRLAERSFAVYSFGKTFHATGWKMGYCIAPKNLMKEFRRVHQFCVYCCNTPIQYAIAEHLKEQSNYMNIPLFYERKRDYFLKKLNKSRFQFTPSSGSYFQILDYSRITTGIDIDFAEHLTREFGVASIPISVFYDKPPENTFLRFCFAKKDETLEKAAKILCKI